MVEAHCQWRSATVGFRGDVADSAEGISFPPALGNK